MTVSLPAVARRTTLAALATAASLALSLPFATQAAAATPYVVTPLVSNGVLPTPYIDANMVNTWGVSFNPVGLVWVTNTRSGTSTLYDGNGVPNALVVKVPPASPTSTAVGSPTGIVFAGGPEFVVSNGTTSGPSRFIFVSQDGLLSGWAPNVDLLNAVRVRTTPGAKYMGLAVATSSTGQRLYATDMAHGRVDMFDANFAPVKATKAFVDPKMPAGMTPFGIQAINNQVYVTYIRQGSGIASAAGVADDLGGAVTASSGSTPDSVIDVFDADGRYLRRAVVDVGMKSPWGLALAPADFGTYSGRLLVGDFHDGTIHAFDATTGKAVGQLKDAKGSPVKIPGLWGFQFGNGVNSQPTNSLFYAAGPNGQGGGVYGHVTVK